MRVFTVGTDTVTVENEAELLLNLIDRLDMDKADSLNEGLYYTKDKKAEQDSYYTKSKMYPIWVYKNAIDAMIDIEALAKHLEVEVEEVMTEELRKIKLIKRLETQCNTINKLLLDEKNSDFRFNNEDMEFVNSEFNLIVGPWIHEDDDLDQLKSVGRLLMYGKYSEKNREYWKLYCRLASMSIKYMMENMSLVKELTNTSDDKCISETSLLILSNLAYIMLDKKRVNATMVWFNRLNLVYNVLSQMINNGTEDEVNDLINSIGEDK